MKVPLLLLTVAVIATPIPAQARSCLPYAPLKVTLSGTLERKTLPASPNVGGVNRADPPETGYFLRLPTVMCVTASTHTEIHELRLLIVQSQYAHLTDELGQTVRLTGTLSESSTRDHHTQLLLRVEAVDGD